MKRNNKWRSVVVGFKTALVAGLLAGSTPSDAMPDSEKLKGFDFTLIATLGAPFPGPGDGNFTFDFEPWSLNNRGQFAFAADLTTGGEGVFLRMQNAPDISQILRAGQPAPDGGTFGGFGVFGHTDLNDNGDMVFAFGRDPVPSPFGPQTGVNAGVYRFAHETNTLSAVVVPDDTEAPGGGVFKGAIKHASLNNRGDITFAGIVSDADSEQGPPGVDGQGLGTGVFLADKKGTISKVVRPGDTAPSGGTFDFAEDTWINDRGDIAFGAHVVDDECIDFGVQQSVRIFCATSVYVKKAQTGEILSIAHQGEPAPGGGTYRLAFGPVLNNRGQIAFIGDLTPAPDSGKTLAVFLHSKGRTISVARPGDPMPGGGNLMTASFTVLDLGLNDRGNVTFSGFLNTDVDNDDVPDTGLFVWSHGTLRLVARTGTTIPGVGTIARLGFPDAVAAGLAPPSPVSGAATNDRGQVFFQATLINGKGVLLLATPN